MAAELSKLNQQANLAHWQQQVYECRHSGMTIKAWCEEQGISIKSYYYRQQKVWKAAQASQQNQEVKLSPQLPPALPAAVITEAITPCAPLIRETNQTEHDIATPIKVAATEPVVIKGSIATPEAIAHVMTQKFVMYSPLYDIV